LIVLVADKGAMLSPYHIPSYPGEEEAKNTSNHPIPCRVCNVLLGQGLAAADHVLPHLLTIAIELRKKELKIPSPSVTP
jgi:hypothetical protein